MSLLTGGALALACLSAPAAGAAPASAARAPAWHVALRQANLNITGVTAGSSSDAWAYGTGKLGGGKLLHWNGRRWVSVAYPQQNTYQIRAAFVLSATDVWFAGNNEAPPLPAEILHWRNGQWSWLAVPSFTNGADVDVLADHDIWSVGGELTGCATADPAGQGCTAVSHWNGSTWRSFPLRAVDTGSGVTFYGSSRTGAWAVGSSYLSHPGTSSQTSVEYAFHWNGTTWEREAAGVRSRAFAPLVVDARDNVWLAEPPHTAPKACADHWNGTSWRAFSLPPGHGTCADAVTDYRSGFWTPHGPGDFRHEGAVGFWFQHWTGKSYPATPTYVPSKNGWNTDGFMIAAVPGSTRVWLYGDYCAVSRVCNNQGVIATLS